MKYNSIGEQLIAKAQELDPNYKPDKFNDMSEALDVILNKTGSEGGDIWLDISPYVNGDTMTISQEGYDLVYNSFSNYADSPINKYVGIDVGGDQKFFFDKSILSNIGGKQGLSFIHKINLDGAEGCSFLNIYEDKSVEFDSKAFDSNLTLPSTSPTSQLIPSITTSNTQQNLTIGNGLEIKNGALISNLSNFKYGTLRLKNITSTNNTYTNTYTIELSFFDYVYDVIINGTSQLMGTSLTRDTFPSFLKNNITPQLFTTFITNIVNIHRQIALMPYFDVTIYDHNNEAVLANCSIVIEGIVGFSCGTNDIDLSNITFGDTFTVEYYGSWYGD